MIEEEENLEDYFDECQIITTAISTASATTGIYNQHVTYLIPTEEQIHNLDNSPDKENGGENFDSDEYSGSLLGMKRDTIDQMYDMYCAHARSLGFSVRKTTCIMSTDGRHVLISKLYVCSCTGVKKESTTGRQLTKKSGHTRTDCKALMRAKLNEEGKYEVAKHVIEHNHPLTRREWNHLHRSERAIKGGKAEAINEMISSGIKPADSFRYLAYTAGGKDQVGHTMIDHLNFVNRNKRKSIEGGDAQTFMELIQNQDEEETQFFYRVQMDEEGRMSNIFWRDSMMKEDFEMYGDVLVFDTTYKTNRYDLICAPFVGINNHWKNTMFGIAFLSDEKIETFEWLFQMFKKSMGGRTPVTIFTDQDLAIAKAIENIFPGSRHRLCLWHIQQNAVSRFGNLKNDDEFKEKFSKCLSGCKDKEEFEDCWEGMIKEYDLQDHDWFTRLYCLKEKWCTTLSKDFFSAGIRSSQRSEATNSTISFNSRKTTGLTEFYGIFNKTLDTWRTNERDDEFKCERMMPDSKLIINGIVRHAARVYTLTIFNTFEREFLKSLSCTSREIGREDTTLLYEVKVNNVTNQVIFDQLMICVTCSCKKFEECGLLCCHCMRVLHINSIEHIPNEYICSRWTKTVKKSVWDKNPAPEMMRIRGSIPWRHQMARKTYNLILECERDEDARKMLEESYERDLIAVRGLKSKECPQQSAETVEGRPILNPKKSITKGRKTRVKNHFQRSKKKKAGIPEEFGSKTPNAHII